MREIHTEIIIDAPADIVWAILTGLSAYRNWNPFILESKGTLALGATLTCRPRLPGSKRVLTFHPKITRLKRNREFAWKGHVLFPGLADGEHIFEIHQRPDGKVRHVHRQEFSGLLVPLISKKTEQKTRLGFEMMNQALKDMAEKATMG